MAGKLNDLDPSELRLLADRMMEGAATGGMFFRLQVAFIARRLRERAGRVALGGGDRER